MKNTFKHICFIAVIAFSFAALFLAGCDNGTTSRGTSLNDTWVAGGGAAVVTINGSSGTITQIGGGPARWQDAVNKGLIRVGNQYFRNLRKTGDLTWTGQELQIKRETSTNAAVDVEWFNTIITMSVDGQTIYTSSSGTTFTRR